MGKTSKRRIENSRLVSDKLAHITWKTCDGENNLSRRRCLKCGADPEARCKKI